MRLIDADELVEALDEALEKRTDPMDALRKQLLVGFAKQILSDAPTVKAIPVEWVEQYLKPFYKHYNALTPGSQETSGAGWTIDVIKEMVKEWENENES